MIQMEDEVYEKLKKDADDNRAIIRIVRILFTFIVVGILFLAIGQHFTSMYIHQREAELQNEIAIAQAKTNKEVMAIESEGMTKDEYFEWLKSRDTE